LKHFTSSKFWLHFGALPALVHQQARNNYELLKQNLQHPSLQFKPVKNGAFRIVRVSLGYRALGVPVDQGVQWF
jgi:hypothetical protein